MYERNDEIIINKYTITKGFKVHD